MNINKMKIKIKVIEELVLKKLIIIHMMNKIKTKTKNLPKKMINKNLGDGSKNHKKRVIIHLKIMTMTINII